jgi:hypothetical protein
MKGITKEEIFQFIGHVTVFYATLDVFMAVLCHTLVPYGSPFRRKIRGSMTLGQRSRLLAELDAETVTNPEALIELQKALPEIIELSEIRNRFIHDQWVFNEQNLERGDVECLRIEFSKDGKLLRETTRYTRATMNRLIRRIGEAQKVVGNVMGKVGGSAGPCGSLATPKVAKKPAHPTAGSAPL